MRPPGGSKHSSRLRALRSAAPSARKLAAASAARLTSWGAQDDLHFPVITRWIISYNLGLVHLNTGQYASAFHYFSTSINLKPDFPSSYMCLARVARVSPPAPRAEARGRRDSCYAGARHTGCARHARRGSPMPSG